MGLRKIAAVVAVSLVAAAGCTSSKEATSDDAETSVPLWILDGVQLARDTKATWDTDSTKTVDTTPAQPAGAKPKSTADRGAVVGALTASGLSDGEANCMYDNLAANASASGAAMSALKAIEASAKSADGAPTREGAAAITSLAALDSETMNRVLLSVVPCLSPDSLATLVAGAQGGSNPAASSLLSSFGLGGTGADLASLASIDTAGLQQALAGLDLNSIAASVAGPLGLDQVDALLQVLNASLSSTGPLAGILNDPLALLNLEQLDLRAIPEDQALLVMLAIARGLTPDQQAQLLQISQARLSALPIKIDPSNMSSDQVRGMLWLVAPLLAETLNAALPDLPPGANLADINLLSFVDRGGLGEQLKSNGVDPGFGLCVFDSLAEMSGPEFNRLTAGTGGASLLGTIGLRSIACLFR